MRKHIGKALQTRSAAIRTALDHYNTAAQTVTPPRPTLKWEEVVEYAFLSDFDLLRDARQDVREQPWATPAGRRAMDQHFKILRAREEIQRLNIEIKRVATHLRDEAQFLKHWHEETLRAANPLLAHQINLYRNVRGRFDGHHRRCLAAIANLVGFTGSVEGGESLDTEPGGSASSPSAATGIADHTPQMTSNETMHSREEEELEAEEEDDEEDALEGEDWVDILSVAIDRVGITG